MTHKLILPSTPVGMYNRLLSIGTYFLRGLAPMLLAFGLDAADSIVITHSEATVGGKVLHYTAKTGLIPIRDNDTGDVHANMFFIAYTLDRLSGVRPLTFLWNGGPGSNSGLVHLLGFGPKRLTKATGAQSRFAPSETALVDNPDTWLAFSDLVFVDPIGTGYSRPVKPEYAAEFYQTRGDAESVAEFIRLYRTRFDAFDAPLFLAGESYGVTRCAFVSDALERRRTHLTGVVMLSGGFPPAEIDPLSRDALYLPALTAAAHFNKKLPADLQNEDLAHALRTSEAYAKGDYMAALEKPGALSDPQRDRVVAQLVRFTGLAANQIDRAKLTVPMEQFAIALLADQNLAVGRYDSRVIGTRDPSPQYDPTTDPSLKEILDNVSMTRYLRNVLGFHSDLNYQGPFGGAYPPATSFRGDWMSVRWNRGPQGRAENPPSPVTAYREAMRVNPNLKTLVVSGYFDLVSNYFAIEQAVAQLPKELAGRVIVRTYAGGHAIYTDDAARHQFRVDAAKFFEGKLQ